MGDKDDENRSKPHSSGNGFCCKNCPKMFVPILQFVPIEKRGKDQLGIQTTIHHKSISGFLHAPFNHHLKKVRVSGRGYIKSVYMPVGTEVRIIRFVEKKRWYQIGIGSDGKNLEYVWVHAHGI